MRRYSWSDAVNRIAKKYGRVAGAKKVSAIARDRYGKVSDLSARELIEIIKASSVAEMPLTKEKIEQAKGYLRLNHDSLPHKRRSLAEIAALISPKAVPISLDTLKRVSMAVRSERKSAGKKVTRFSSSGKRHNDAKVLGALRLVVSGNLKFSFYDAAKIMTIQPTTLQRIFKRNKTSFRAIKKQAFSDAVRALDAQTGFSLTAKELSARLSQNPKTAERYRNRLGGRKVGASVRIKRVANDALSMLGVFTSFGPKGGVLNKKQLGLLAGDNGAIGAALKELVSEKLAFEVDYEGSGLFCISPKGLRELKARRVGNNSRAERISAMSLDELVLLRQRLFDARYSAGVGVPGTAIKFLDEWIVKKRMVSLRN